MLYPAPNLQALLEKLPQGSFARKLVAVFATHDNIEAVRKQLREIVEEEIRLRKE
jgi:hypothetical protein